MFSNNTKQPEHIGSVLSKLLESVGTASIPTKDAGPKPIGGQYISEQSLEGSFPIPQKKSKAKSGNHLLLLSCIESIEVKYHKLYCLATRRTLQRLLSIYHGIDVSLRTISRYIKRLKTEGFIELLYRRKKYPDGKIRQKATLFKVIKRGWQYLRGAAITAARRYGLTRLTKSPTNQLFSTEKDYNEIFTAEKIYKFCKTHNLKDGLPSTPEACFNFIRSL
jgi:hypothetical protein